MKTKHTKNSIIKRYYALKGTSEMPEWNALIIDIEKYTSENGLDRELKYLLLALKAGKIDYYDSTFDKCCEIALPIFEGLQDVKKLDFLGITILAQVIKYNADYNRSIDLAHEVMDILEKDFSHERGYLGITLMIAGNMTLRLLRAKYNTTTAKHKKINAQFSHFLDIAIDMCNKYDLTVIKAVLMVRDGVYNADYDQIHENLEWLIRAPGESRTYKSTLDEIGEYVQHLEDDKLSNALLNCLIGFHAKKQREHLGITQEEVADALETERNVVNQIERGETGTSYQRLAKLRKILDVDYNYLFLGRGDDEPTAPTEEDLLLHKIRLMLKDIPIEYIEAGLEFAKTMSKISAKSAEKQK